ncbi:hypothetical protein GEV33_000051 [Tenebrio molitor]|uniref:Uncharacterized protein n=1 Tax=Tenebrio molitor TaxID=7067 RepID=A0A8J6LRA6_TENMO|nr:hypothetical protein GEV33_000051 [Tenebrio molitor]
MVVTDAGMADRFFPGSIRRNTVVRPERAVIGTDNFLTTKAKIGTGRTSPGVVRLGPPWIAATVVVRAPGKSAGPSSASGAVVGPLSGTVLQRRGQGVTSGETCVRTTVRCSVV